MNERRSTGLIDINGIEIHEGDLIRMKSYNHHFKDRYTYEVYYSPKDCRFRFRNNEKYPDNVDDDSTSHYDFEIIKGE